ncbi:zona pellucida sperm-binding protein 2 [Pelodytes ibericus]
MFSFCILLQQVISFASGLQHLKHTREGSQWVSKDKKQVISICLHHGVVWTQLQTLDPCITSYGIQQRFLLFGFLQFQFSNAAKVLDFPDPVGVPIMGCKGLVEGKVANIPENCIEHEVGRRILHMAFNESAGHHSIYRIICDDAQADIAPSGPVVNCTQDYMSVKFPRMLSSFDDEVASAPVRGSFWNIEISDGTKLTVSQARKIGYMLSSDLDFFMIQVFFNASGLKEYQLENQKLYVGSVQLSSLYGTPKFIVESPMVCARGPPTCNQTHMTITIPSFGGILYSVTIDGVDVSSNAYQQKGISLTTKNGNLWFYILKSYLKVDRSSGYDRYYFPSLILTFQVNDVMVPMLLTPSCPVASNSFFLGTVCTKDGFMVFEIVEAFTTPKLNLDTVIFGDGTCQPSRTPLTLSYRVPLEGCGTKKIVVNGVVIYENEAHALWKDSPPRRISRDSELRLTLRCKYDSSANTVLSVQVVTLPPPVSSKSEGPLSLVLELFPDVSYRNAFSDGQYPVVKTLREPIYLEVRVLNRNDADIELVLDDCWATMSNDPNSVPQWNVVVDGCQEKKDNFLTVFHPVSGVSLPTHRKRFEVKAFTFLTNSDQSTNLVYFHCSVVICNTKAPDSPLCSKKCLASRKRRDGLHKDSSMVTLPGPILFLEGDMSVRSQAKTSFLGQLALGLLPAFALTAVILFGVCLNSVFKLNSKHVAQ